jgi:HEAT repeat protein
MALEWVEEPDFGFVKFADRNPDKIRGSGESSTMQRTELATTKDDPVYESPRQTRAKPVRHVAPVAQPGKLKDPRAIQPLINALNGKAPYVRENAVDALDEIADPRVLEALEATAAHDGNPSVRLKAELAARKIRRENRGK